MKIRGSTDNDSGDETTACVRSLEIHAICSDEIAVIVNPFIYHEKSSAPGSLTLHMNITRLHVEAFLWALLKQSFVRVANRYIPYANSLHEIHKKGERI